MTTFEPFGDRVLIRPMDEEDVSAGGIIIPDLAKNRPYQGFVVAVGPGEWEPEAMAYRPAQVAVGDEVLYGKYAGTLINLDDEEYFIMNSADIFGKVVHEKVDG